MGKKLFSLKKDKTLILALIICLAFFTAYSILSLVRHNHFGSFGYDLGINDQLVWRYSTFQLPITTSDPFPDETKLTTHIEIVYALISPIYWIWNSAKMLLITDAFFMCFSGLAVFLLARRKKLIPAVSLAVAIAYLMFFGVQNAMWFDVHSASFAAGFLAWFIYFMEDKKYKFAALFFLLAITAKENIAILTLLISLVYFVKQRERVALIFLATSLAYLFFVYAVYFPHIIQKDYLYQNESGFLSNLSPVSLIDSSDKREAIFYSFASFGLLPLAAPVYLLPVIGDFATYFVVASDLTGSHGVFMHYRVTLAPLLAWALIMAITRLKKLNHNYTAIYLLACTLLVQYFLHLPLSYLTKSWFWTEPSGVKNITFLKSQLKSTDSVVAQNNIIPHISHRDKIYTLYPEKKTFGENSPCGAPECDWFRWHNKPDYLFIDTSPEWDIRHFLANREEYIKGLANLESAGIIEKYKETGNTVIYKVFKNP